MTATINPTTLTSEIPGAGAGALTPGSTRAWLRAEGLAAFVAGLAIFGAAGGPWLLAVPLLLVPDVSMIGYLRGPRLGALTYNLVHTWVPGLVALGLGAWTGFAGLTLAGGILVAHVGMDRAMGYGLKLPTSFGDTHLGRIGKQR
jgi:hypothetical protein